MGNYSGRVDGGWWGGGGFWGVGGEGLYLKDTKQIQSKSLEYTAVTRTKRMHPQKCLSFGDQYNCSKKSCMASIQKLLTAMDSGLVVVGRDP